MADERKERLAAQLRANLRQRKSQARARRVAGPDATPVAGPDATPRGDPDGGSESDRPADAKRQGRGDRDAGGDP